MPFDLDSIYLFYALAAGSAVLFVEATYLLFFSAASYRSRINRRLRLVKNEPDRESVLVQLRRERGLTADGLYALPSIVLNRLILQSGVTIGVRKFLLLDTVTAIVVFGGMTRGARTMAPTVGGSAAVASARSNLSGESNARPSLSLSRSVATGTSAGSSNT